MISKFRSFKKFVKLLEETHKEEKTIYGPHTWDYLLDMELKRLAKIAEETNEEDPPISERAAQLIICGTAACREAAGLDDNHL